MPLSPSAPDSILIPCTAVMQEHVQGESLRLQGALRTSENRAAASRASRQATQLAEMRQAGSAAARTWGPPGPPCCWWGGACGAPPWLFCRWACEPPRGPRGCCCGPPPWCMPGCPKLCVQQQTLHRSFFGPEVVRPSLLLRSGTVYKCGADGICESELKTSWAHRDANRALMLLWRLQSCRGLRTPCLTCCDAWYCGPGGAVT